ncbi:PaaI family thioesterase [Georgenia sp. Z1344]|uniref:PaaI family thioesterase n=1 Tax=Georgenia sp. Z1344 TaxID=3416706 RepID=UPI003CEA29F4
MSPREQLPLLTAAEVEAELLRSPYHRWLGLRVVDVTRSSVVIEVEAREEFIADVDAGYVHGGILATLLDLAADWALVGALGTGVPTIDLSVNYLRAAQPGLLRVTGRAIRPGRQVSHAEAEVHDADGRLLAVGRGSFLSAVAEQGRAAADARRAAAHQQADQQEAGRSGTTSEPTGPDTSHQEHTPA